MLLSSKNCTANAMQAAADLLGEVERALGALEMEDDDSDDE